MYILYIDHVLFPVAPGKIVVKTKTENEVIDLVDGSFTVKVGGVGPKRIEVELLLPMSRYPFASYENGFCDGGYYVDELNRIIGENKPVWFDVYRTFPDMNKTYLTNILVTVDSVEITENAENGMDMTAKVNMTEYRKCETKIVDEKKKKSYRTDAFEAPLTYTVKRGDSLWLICKRFFDDGSMYKSIAELNNIKAPYTLYEGQVIKLRG